MSVDYYIEGDGSTHINVYSRGKTDVGKMLSNFYNCNIETPDGRFKSIEGYWFWLQCRDDELKDMWGVEAKKYGEYHCLGFMKPDDFEQKIKIATFNKIMHNGHIKNALLEVDVNIPFVHYYVYDGKITDKSDNFQIYFLNDLKLILKHI